MAPRRILIIKPSSLGDVVHALPVLAGLRRAYPQAHLAWLVATSFAPLLAGHPLLDEVISFDRRRYGRILQSPRACVDFVRFVHGLRRRQFDLVLDLQGLFRSGFLALATGAAQRVGFREARELAPLFYSRRIDGGAPVEREQGRPTGPAPTHGPDVHAVDRNLTLARALGLPVDPPAFPLGLRDEELENARKKLREVAGRRVSSFTALLPGARWDTKRWRADLWSGLADNLHDEQLPPGVLLGSADDRTFADQILSHCSAAPPLDLVGRTSLRELCALLACADLVVSHDSGPMHIAAALDRPLVAIFGPTNAGRTGPYSAVARVVALRVPCAPCYRRRCPLGHHDCMQKLDLEAVRRAVREMWAAAGGRSASE